MAVGRALKLGRETTPPHMAVKHSNPSRKACCILLTTQRARH